MLSVNYQGTVRYTVRPSFQLLGTLLMFANGWNKISEWPNLNNFNCRKVSGNNQEYASVRHRRILLQRLRLCCQGRQPFMLSIKRTNQRDGSFFSNSNSFCLLNQNTASCLRQHNLFIILLLYQWVRIAKHSHAIVLYSLLTCYLESSIQSAT